MLSSSNRVKLIFRKEYGEPDLDDAKARGFLSHVFVQIDEAFLYPVFFYTPQRLATDLQVMEGHGEPFIVEVGMLVVAEITLDLMERTVEKAFLEHFFKYMVPMKADEIVVANKLIWPP